LKVNVKLYYIRVKYIDPLIGKVRGDKRLRHI